MSAVAEPPPKQETQVGSDSALALRLSHLAPVWNTAFEISSRVNETFWRMSPAGHIWPTRRRYQSQKSATKRNLWHIKFERLIVV